MIRAAIAISVLIPLPVLADRSRVETFHCHGTCPIGAPENAVLVVREIYTLSADPLTKMAVWVAYRVTPEAIGPSQSRNWAADPWLRDDEALEPEDYDGANDALGVDRGHQTPLAAFSGTTFWPQTNYLSNITPQASALNQAPWQRLEARETAFAKAENSALYVLTGPLFERLMQPLPKANERHRVPSGYWKVIIAPDGRMSSFLFDQTTPRNADYCDMQRDLDEIELRARLQLVAPGNRNNRSLHTELGCAARTSPTGVPASIHPPL